MEDISKSKIIEAKEKQFSAIEVIDENGNLFSEGKGKQFSVIEIIERKGEAQTLPPIRDPEKIEITGTLGAPVEFITKRGHLFNKDTVNVQYSYESGFITLSCNEDSYFKTIIKGAIEKSFELKNLKINSDNSFDPKSLAKLLRKNKHLFANKEYGIGIITSLNNFKAKVKSEYDNQDDKRGTIKRSYEQIVESNIPSGFALSIPIFKGFGKELIIVEIEINEDLKCSLFSDELYTLEAEIAKDAIDEQLKSLSDYVQIEV